VQTVRATRLINTPNKTINYQVDQFIKAHVAPYPLLIGPRVMCLIAIGGQLTARWSGCGVCVFRAEVASLLFVCSVV
jgi:hypothetical protein